MCIQGTWTDALIIQAVVDALKVTIQIVESNQDFEPLTTVYPVQERNTSSTIGHVRYINILTGLRGFQVKLLYLVLFSLYPILLWELRDKRK